MTKILGIGNALVDALIQIEDDSLLNELNLPKGSMQLVDSDKSTEIQNKSKGLKTEMASGGSAANTIHGLAKLGMETSFIGTVGKDENGNFFKTDLVKNNISPLLIMSDSPSGVANTMISKDGERTFGTFLGAAIELSADGIVEDLFKDHGLLHIEGYLVQNHDLVESILQKAKSNGLKISVDLASYNVVEDNLEFLQEMISKYVDIVFANEEEAKAFTGMEPEDALNSLAQICETAVVKIGGEGSMIKTGDKIDIVKIDKLTPIDTTGAGDIYAAGFLYGYINNLGNKKSGEIGSLLASNVIQVIGAKISDKNWEIINPQVNN